ncbi:MAG: trypsin-like peptidase domain-containing protein [Alphaproteobacteria bacterium]|nr:trypsin-like peptidase domain-containing protein [Alphaproteobacteria bacterium]
MLMLSIFSLILSTTVTAPAVAQDRGLADRGLADRAVVGESAQWERTLEAAVPAIVSLRVVSTRAFDTEQASSSVATGFIVDAERGIILTNRHVVTPGPVVAEAVFLDHEEVPVQAIYRDPVHDFGFYRFDPKDVRFMDVDELELHPEGARVGVDVRIVGNDAGEQVSILAGTLARLDRPAPAYGRFRFNDFNTFYIQAASGTSGGSSGSPVLDREGRVVALNAGSSRQAASSFFLPLDRVVRALEYVQRGEQVPRGTWQASMILRPFDELSRLGLSAETEARVRKEAPHGTGMLVIEGLVPGGTAHGLLELGDIVIEVGGALIDGHVRLEALLDDNVGGELPVVVERGGQRVELTIPVQDLHEITPDSYLEVGDVVLNELSYQQARHALVPVGGAYVAASGYMLQAAGVGRNAVITAIGADPIYSLDDAQAALESLPDGAQVPVRFFDLAEPKTERVGVFTMDRRWFPMRRCTWEAETGDWPCQDGATAPPMPPMRVSSTDFPDEEARIEDRLAPSLVLVDFDIPYRVEGVYGSNYIGAGVVVDAEQGLVVVDRDTVPIALGDVRITFGGSVRIPARVVHLHPLHNLAVLQYDPALLGDTPVRGVTLSPEPLSPGDKVWHVGLDSRARVVSQKTRVERTDPLYLPTPSPPFFRDGNLEVVDIAEAARSSGGVLTDRKGRVKALWASFVDLSGEEPQAFFRGLPAAYIEDVVEPLRRGETPTHRSLGIDLVEVGLVDARDRGLPEAEAQILEAAAGTNRRVFLVTRIWADAPARGVLQEGDLLLAVDGEPALDLRRIEEAARADAVELRIARRGEVRTEKVATIARTAQGVDRVVSWAGTLLHEPHDAIPEQRGLVPNGVYVAWYWYGSPAARYGLRATRRILEVNGTPTPDLDTFLAAVGDLADGGAVRLKTADLDGRMEVDTLKVDLTYWPTWELRRTDAGWQRTELRSQAAATEAPKADETP